MQALKGSGVPEFWSADEGAKSAIEDAFLNAMAPSIPGWNM
jgi:hypothetical protein